MSTTLLTIVAGLLVFSPVLFELVRAPLRALRSRPPRAREINWPIQSEAEVEASVQQMLYGREPAGSIDVMPQAPAAGRGAQLRPVDPPPAEQPAAEQPPPDVQAA